MNVKEFIKENFKGKEIEDFEKAYKQKYTKQAFYKFSKIDLDKFNGYRWQLLANHFTGGDVAKIFSMYCNSKQTVNIHPEYKKV